MFSFGIITFNFFGSAVATSPDLSTFSLPVLIALMLLWNPVFAHHYALSWRLHFASAFLYVSLLFCSLLAYPFVFSSDDAPAILLSPCMFTVFVFSLLKAFMSYLVVGVWSYAAIFFPHANLGSAFAFSQFCSSLSGFPSKYSTHISFCYLYGCFIFCASSSSFKLHI